MLNRIVIHQWRDWLLEHIGGNNYELTQKINKSVLPITAKDGMDAENKSRQLIKGTETKDTATLG